MSTIFSLSRIGSGCFLIENINMSSYRINLRNIDIFLDFFRQLFRVETKIEKIISLHKEIFDSEKKPEHRINTLINMIDCFHPSNQREFHAKMLIDKDFLQGDEMEVAIYYKDILLIDSLFIKQHDRDVIEVYFDFEYLVGHELINDEECQNLK